MAGTTIHVLPQEVVDRIAAGEVVQRASSAIKELLENSLDASATSIKITVSDVDSFSVSDNGTGISKDDLELACTRHATSKLTTYDDLNSIASFGFRGEALASLSMVANVKIVSRTASSNVGYCKHYKLGKPVSDTTPAARTIGTTVTASSLFYNIPNRRKTMKLSTEYNHVLKVLQKYAIRIASQGVILQCSKASAVPDLNTTSCMQTTSPHKTAVCQIYGSNLDLVDFTASLSDGSDNIYSAKGFMSAASSTAKKRHFCLFINSRLVEGCRTIQRALESMYTECTGSAPVFLYLDIAVPPNTVDVNVHPTKAEVTLLHQDTILNHLCNAIREQLQGSSGPSEIAFKKRKGPPSSTKKGSSSPGQSPPPEVEPAKKSRVEPKHKIRTSRSTQSGALEPFVTQSQMEHDITCPKHYSNIGAFANVCQCPRLPPIVPRKFMRVIPTDCSYTSIKNLRKRVAKRREEAIESKLRKAVLVGSLFRYRSLIQCGPELVLWNHATTSTNLFYQLALNQFAGFDTAELPKIDIAKVIASLLQIQEDQSTEISESNQMLADQASTCLQQHAHMLEEYFGIRIEDGSLVGLPILLQGYRPVVEGLPLFLLRLATEVNWMSEKACFHGVCKELGAYYSQLPNEKHESIVRHWMFPAVSSLLVPDNPNDFVTLTSLPELYKVFERC